MKAANFKTQIPQVGRIMNPQSHTAKAVSPMDSGGDRNPLQHVRKQQLKWLIGTYNTRSIATDARLEELLHELTLIKWHILGISETRRRGEGLYKLANGNTVFYKGKDNESLSGVAIIIHKEIMPNVKVIKAITDRVIYITIGINTKTAIKIIQCYAPTSSCEEEEAEAFYEDLTKAIEENKTKYTLLLGDLNAKIGTKKDITEEHIGNYGIGDRNKRGDMLVNFMEQQQLYCMNTFFKKNPSRKWTWISPNGQTRNEIDLILTDCKHIIQDVSVLANFHTGSDHRLVRAKLIINHKLERRQMISHKQHPLDVEKLKENAEAYQEELKEKLIDSQIEQEQDINKINAEVTKALKESANQYARNTQRRKEKLSDETKHLLQQRRQLIKENKRHTIEYAEINKLARRMAKDDILKSKEKEVERLIQQNRGLKIFRRQNQQKKEIIKIKNKEGETITDRDEILKTAQEFYQDLYRSQKRNNSTKTESKRKILNEGSEDIPPINEDEIRYALHKTKNRKAPGNDQIIPEMLKEGGSKLWKELARLFNICIEKGDIPEEWENAIVILIHKKGDTENLENYRPISLLSQVYKLFSRVILNRLENKLDIFINTEQAGFRKNYSTLDHIQTMKILIERTREYNIPLWLGFVDFRKAFDSIEIWAVMKALKDARIDHRYSKIIEKIYDNATMQIKLHSNTEKIKIQKGVRQGDVISPKLFLIALENVFKNLNWEKKGILIEGQRLNHLCFADDIVLIAQSREELQTMLNELQKESGKIGLEMNMNKTKVCTNDKNDQEDVVVADKVIEKKENYVYLGQVLVMTGENQTEEIERRIKLSWAAYGKVRDIMTTNIPLHLKTKIYNECILPVTTYACETWTFTQKNINKLRVHQRAVERRILNISLRDHKTNEWIRHKTKVTDIIQRITTLKWNWAGHAVRKREGWCTKVIKWRPWGERRNRGRPFQRWADDIKKQAGLSWYRKAEDRNAWRNMREAYTRKWVDEGL